MDRSISWLVMAFSLAMMFQFAINYAVLGMVGVEPDSPAGKWLMGGTLASYGPMLVAVMAVAIKARLKEFRALQPDVNE